jgi:rRNA-processing protein FCF1
METCRLGYNKGVKTMIKDIDIDKLETLLSTGNEFIVILDTSSLMAIGSGKPSLENLLEAIEGKPVLIIPKTVSIELEKHSGNARFSVSSKASLALTILKKIQIGVYRLKQVYSNQADDDIYLIASKLRKGKHMIAVATLDRGLRKRIKALGIPVIYLRRTENRFELM